MAAVLGSAPRLRPRGPHRTRLLARDRARLGITLGDEQIDEIITLDMASWERLDEDLVDLVRSLAADGMRVGLLSNISHDLAHHYENRHPDLLALFDVLGLSCRIGAAKPEPDAYLWCSHTFGLPPERILFIDDREANVAGAVKIGMQGHRFTTRAGLTALLSHQHART